MEARSSQTILDCQPSIRGKVAFVTGGLGGIGRACVQALVAHGARVAFTFADGHEPEATALELVASNPSHLSAHALDLRFNQSIKSSLDQALERWGQIDILLNNAAVGSATVSAYASDPAAQDSAMLLINADGTLKVCQAFLKLTRDQARDQVSESSRKIINISSVGGGLQAFPGFHLSDGMSKAAVAFLTRQLAAELTDSRIDVFAICPGATNTRMFQESTLNPMTPAQRESFIRSMPKRRLIEPEEIANLVVFLASAYSTPLHGAVIDASMGLGVRPGLITERAH
jgi:NAD(P)-dependent dehydrogenase (short-subunit alcohol dehydrogenase family)